jgi:hypothetical protein
MQIPCSCGARIVDQTDYLPNKGHLIADLDWFGIFDAIDTRIIDALACGRLEPQQAYQLAREIIRRSSRLLYQCQSCGRLFVDDLEGNSQCYLPATDETSREVLRSRRN